MKKTSILIFIGVALSADLKTTIYPYIHWIFWLLLIMPFIVRDYFKKGIVISRPLIISPLIFFVGYLISSMFYENADSFIQFVKFILIFLTLFYFIHYTQGYYRVIFPFINILLLLNAVMILLGYFEFFPTARILTGEGRWGTLLNYPGSLVKIGVISLFYNLMVIFLDKEKRKVGPLLCILLSIMLILFDGSRTGILLSIMLLAISPIIIWKESISKKLMLLMPGCLLILLFFIDISKIINTRLENNLLTFEHSDGILMALNNIDPARYGMLNAVFNKILENPFIGGGPFSTVFFYSNGSSMVVHNAYLQIWGDYGLLGVIGFIGITCSWVLILPKILKKTFQSVCAMTKSAMYSSILMLLYFNLSGLFHPYSTEFSEWLTFIIPVSVYYSFYFLPQNQEILVDENKLSR